MSQQIGIVGQGYPSLAQVIAQNTVGKSDPVLARALAPNPLGMSDVILPMTAALLTAAGQAKKNRKALPWDEQVRLENERKAREENRRVEWFINQGKCPKCGHKLIRGKKDKTDDNKRSWVCSKCQIDYHM